jgi:virginiamycin B lyase
LVALTCASSAGAVTITEFPANPGKISVPNNIIAGPGGNLWWTEAGQEPGIGRMSPTGERFAVIHANGHPFDLVAAPNGWVSWVGEGSVGRYSPFGAESDEAVGLQGGAIVLTAGNEIRVGGSQGASATVVCSPKKSSSEIIEAELACLAEKNGNPVEGLAASPGNVLWASIFGSDKVNIFTATPLTSGDQVDLPTGSGPKGIAIGPEGNAWVAMWEAGAIDRITPSGSRTRFLLPAGSRPNDLVLGPDGAFWIVESGTGKIARMTTAGLVTGEYPIPSGETGQTGITVGPDGNLWFTDSEVGLIGKVVPDPLNPGGGGTPGGGAAPVAPAPLPADKIAPRFTGAPAFSPARFRVAAGKSAAPRGGAPSGSTLKFSLSETASVTATFALKVSGRRAGKNCVAPGKAKPGAAKCFRYLPKGTLSLKGAAGANKIVFSGKVNGKFLSPGAYQASLTARDSASNASAITTASFTIVR